MLSAGLATGQEVIPIDNKFRVTDVESSVLTGVLTMPAALACLAQLPVDISHRVEIAITSSCTQLLRSMILVVCADLDGRTIKRAYRPKKYRPQNDLALGRGSRTLGRLCFQRCVKKRGSVFRGVCGECLICSRSWTRIERSGI